MGYVSGYQYDVFISYAHEDNRDGWVDRFQEALSNRLDMMFGVSVTIFWDRKLEPTNVWSEEIGRAIRNCRCVIADLTQSLRVQRLSSLDRANGWSVSTKSLAY
jgi:hypothetical protein